MVRESRHILVGNLPENIGEERIKEHFKRYGRVQSVKLLGGCSPSGGEDGGSASATVAFVDICAASKALKSDNRLEDRLLKTTYYEPSRAHFRDHFASQQSPARSPRYPVGLAEDIAGYDRSSHFYEGRRGGGDEAVYGSQNNRRTFVSDGDYVSSGVRGRIRTYLRGGSGYGINSGGRSEPNEYRWNGGQYRYIQDQYSDDKCSGVRRVLPSQTPPSVVRERTRRSGAGHKEKRRKLRSGSESRSSSCTSRSSASSHSSSSSRSRSLRCSSRSPSPSPRRHEAVSSLSCTSTVSSSQDRRPVAICVQNLSPYSSEQSLKDGLFHDYKKHGKVTSVKILGSGQDRYGIVCFRKPDDAERALTASHDKYLFGLKLQVTLYDGLEIEEESRSYDIEQDEYDHKASRTLFIGNLDKDITSAEIKKHFESFGEILEPSSLAAVSEMRGRTLCGKRIQVDYASRECTDNFFGKSEKQGSQVIAERVSRDSENSYEEYTPTNGTTYDDSYERELREYAGTQRFDASSSLERKHSPSRKKEDVAALSPLPKDAEEIPSSPGIALPEFDVPIRSKGHSRSSDQDSFHSPSPNNSRVASPPLGKQKTSNKKHPSRSPVTPVASSPSREVTLLDDRSLPDPRKRCSGDLKDLVVRVNRAPESPQHRVHKSRSEVGDEDIVTSTCSANHELQDPRLHYRHNEDTSHYNYVAIDKERNVKKLKHDNYELAFHTKIMHDSSDFRKPFCSKKGIEIKQKKDSWHCENTHSLPHLENRHTRSSNNTDAESWKTVPVVSSTCDAEHNNISPPGTPVRDEKDDSLSETSSNHYAHHISYFRERVCNGPLSLPLPKFAHKLKSHISSRAVSASPKTTVSICPLKSPSFSNIIVNNVLEANAKPVEEVEGIVADTPVSPGSLSSDTSDSEISSPTDINEQLKAFNEKYEKWNESAKFSSSTATYGLLQDSQDVQKNRVSLNLPVQPSPFVKSLLSKPSIFEEDSKRLEKIEEKYKPKPFCTTTLAKVSSSICSALSSYSLPRISAAVSEVPLATSVNSSTCIKSSFQPPASMVAFKLPSPPLVKTQGSLVCCTSVSSFNQNSCSVVPVIVTSIQTPVTTSTVGASVCISTYITKNISQELVLPKTLESSVVTVGADTRITSISSITQTVSNSTAVLTTTSACNISVPIASVSVKSSIQNTLNICPKIEPTANIHVDIKLNQVEENLEVLDRKDINIINSKRPRNKTDYSDESSKCANVEPLIETEVKNILKIELAQESQKVEIKKENNAEEDRLNKRRLSCLEEQKSPFGDIEKETSSEALDIEPLLKKVKIEETSREPKPKVYKEKQEDCKKNEKSKKEVEEKAHIKTNEEKNSVKINEPEGKHKRLNDGKSHERFKKDSDRHDDKRDSKEKKKEKHSSERKEKREDKERYEGDKLRLTSDNRVADERKEKYKERKDKSKDKERSRSSSGAHRDRERGKHPDKNRCKEKNKQHGELPEKDLKIHTNADNENAGKKHAESTSVARVEDVSKTSHIDIVNDKDKTLKSKLDNRGNYNHIAACHYSDVSDDDIVKTTTNEACLHQEEKYGSKSHDRKHHITKNEKCDSKYKISSHSKHPVVKRKGETLKISNYDDGSSADESKLKEKTHLAKRTKKRATSSSSSSSKSKSSKGKTIINSDSGSSQLESEEEIPKKHSFFEIPVYDGCYDMYDKVKARRLKLQQKQEEEKRQQQEKQKLMQEYKQKQKNIREKKNSLSVSCVAYSSDSSDDEKMSSKKSHKSLVSSSDEDDMSSKKCSKPSGVSSDSESFSPKSYKDKKKSLYKKEHHRKGSLRRLSVLSDITSEEEPRLNGPLLSPESVNSSSSHIKRKKEKMEESDSDLSDHGIRKPPKPALSAAKVKISSKSSEKKKNKFKEKVCHKNSLSSSDESILEMSQEVFKKSPEKVKSDQFMKKWEPHEKGRRECRIEEIFGVISDNSDSNFVGSQDSEYIHTVSKSSRVDYRSVYMTDSEEETKQRPDESKDMKSPIQSMITSENSCEYLSSHDRKSIKWQNDYASSNLQGNVVQSDSGKGSSSGISSGSSAEECLLTFKQESLPLLAEMEVKKTDTVFNDLQKQISCMSDSTRKDKKRKKNKHSDRNKTERSSKHIPLVDIDEGSLVSEVESTECISRSSPTEFVLGAESVSNGENVFVEKNNCEEPFQTPKTYKEDIMSLDSKTLNGEMHSFVSEKQLALCSDNKISQEDPESTTLPSHEIIIENNSSLGTNHADAESAVKSIEASVENLASRPELYEENSEVTAEEQPTNGTENSSRAIISHEETMNAVAGLLAYIDDYENNSVPSQEHASLIITTETASGSDEVDEEAQKAAQMLQSEMPGAERDDRHVDGWGVSQSETVISSRTDDAELTEMENNTDNEHSDVIESNVYPDSPASESALQIVEDTGEQHKELKDGFSEHSVIGDIVQSNTEHVDQIETVVTTDAQSNECIVIPEKEVNNDESAKEKETNDALKKATEQCEDIELTKVKSTIPITNEIAEQVVGDVKDDAKVIQATCEEHADTLCAADLNIPVIEETDKPKNITDSVSYGQENKHSTVDVKKVQEEILGITSNSSMKLSEEQVSSVTCPVKDDSTVDTNIKEDGKNCGIGEDPAKISEENKLTIQSTVTTEQTEIERSDETCKRIRGRSRGGRNRRSIKKVAPQSSHLEIQDLEPSIVTRSAKGRRRGGRVTRSSELKEESVSPKPRRSTRNIRMRKHPDMVNHDEATGRRRRGGRGGKNVHNEDSKVDILPSDIYDFHDSDDDKTLKGSKGKRSPSKVSAAGEADQEAGSLSTRKSKRLQEKVPEDLDLNDNSKTKAGNEVEVKSEETVENKLSNACSVSDIKVTSNSVKSDSLLYNTNTVITPAVVNFVKGEEKKKEIDTRPTPLVDPETGFLTPMKMEEGQYVPIKETVSVIPASVAFVTKSHDSMLHPEKSMQVIPLSSSSELYSGPNYTVVSLSNMNSTSISPSVLRSGVNSPRVAITSMPNHLNEVSVELITRPRTSTISSTPVTTMAGSLGPVNLSSNPSVTIQPQITFSPKGQILHNHIAAIPSKASPVIPSSITTTVSVPPRRASLSGQVHAVPASHAASALQQPPSSVTVSVTRITGTSRPTVMTPQPVGAVVYKTSDKLSPKIDDRHIPPQLSDDRRGGIQLVNIPKHRFAIEPPHIDVMRYSNAPPSTPSPIGRSHEPENLPPAHMARTPYELHARVAPSQSGPTSLSSPLTSSKRAITHYYANESEFQANLPARRHTGEHLLTSPPLHTSTALTPPPAHHPINQALPSQGVLPPFYFNRPLIYEKNLLMPLDMKSGVVDATKIDKLDSRSNNGTPAPVDYPPTILVTREKSSPHISSPHHERFTDSPHVIYARRYPPFDCSIYASHPGTPGVSDHIYPPSDCHCTKCTSQLHIRYDSLQYLLQDFHVMWAGPLGLKEHTAEVNMYFISGSLDVCKMAFHKASLNITQRMRLEQSSLDGVARKMLMDAEHCVLMALPRGRDYCDLFLQQTNLKHVITYLETKQAAGIVNSINDSSHKVN